MRAAKTDGPHAEIRDGLRALGVFVIDTHRLGNGFPDLVAWSPVARWQLLEVKMPGGILTDDECKLHDACPGPIWIVLTLKRACQIMGVEVSDEDDASQC